MMGVAGSAGRRKWLAVTVACGAAHDLAARLDGLDGIGQAEAGMRAFLVPGIVGQWRAAVQEDVTADPFSPGEDALRGRDDAAIAYGTWISVEALLAPIIGGVGTVFGPLVGAIALHGLGELAKAVAGRVPGVDLVLFGLLLVVAVAVAPGGILGLARGLRARLGAGAGARVVEARDAGR